MEVSEWSKKKEKHLKTNSFLAETGHAKSKTVNGAKQSQDAPEIKFFRQDALKSGYLYILYDWNVIQDKRITIMIWLGNDVKPNNIKARVQQGSRQVTVLTKMTP